MLVTDCVLVSDDEFFADGLRSVRRELPGVVAVLGLPLSNILFASARGRVREYRRAAAGSAGRAVGVLERGEQIVSPRRAGAQDQIGRASCRERVCQYV